MKYRNFKRHILLLVLLIAFMNFEALCQSTQTRDIIMRMEHLLDIISRYEYDKSREWLQDFQNVMQEVYLDPLAIKETEELMLLFLQSDATPAGKQFICNHFGTIAAKNSIPVIKGMLADEKTAEMALLVLEKIQDPAAGKAMVNSLQKSDIKIKIAIINSLGASRYDKAVKPLAKLVYDKDPLISESAVSALGAIGTYEAAEILKTATNILTGDLKWQAMDAWLKCADRFVMENKHADAQIIYEKVNSASSPLFLHKAALKGMFITTNENPVDFIIKNLQNGDPEILPSIISLIYELPDNSNPGRIYKETTSLSGTNQLYLLTAIASSGDRSIHPEVINAINHDDLQFRLAGLKAIAKTGSSSDIIFLAEKASAMRGIERDRARESLYTMSGLEVDKAILFAIEEADPKIKVELIRSIGERNISSAVDLLLKLSRDPDLAVRIESIEALGKIASPDYLPKIIQILIDAPSERERKMAETTIYLVTLKMPDGSRKSEDIISILSLVRDLSTLNSLIAILGEIGDNRDFTVLKEYLNSEYPEIQLAAIRALSIWPDATPKDDLKTIADTTEDTRKHTLAMRGYVQVVIADENLSQDQRFTEIHNAFNIASNTAEQKIVLSGLGKIISLEALKFAISLLDKSELVNETEAAILNISSDLSWGFPDETREELQKVLQLTTNENLKREIEELLKNIQK